MSLYLLSDKASDMKDTYLEDSLLGKGKNVEINYANTYSHYLQLKYQVAKMRRHFCFVGPFYILIFIYLLKYKTIETHARAFLPLNISAVDSVY